MCCDDRRVDLPVDLLLTDGITLELHRVLRREARVYLECEVRDDEAYHRRAAEHEEAMRAWEVGAVQEQHAWESRGDLSVPRPPLRPPPAQPADLFADLAVSVTDDHGSPYRFLGSSLGGTGLERQVRWRFEPTASTNASSLSVTIDGSVRWTGPC